MRSRHLVSAAFGLFPLFGVAQSQDASTPSRRIGFAAGISSSTLGGKDAGNASRLTGIVAGGVLVLPVSPSFSFQPELLFAMKGEHDTGGSRTSIKTNYFEIPLLLRFDLAGLASTKPFFYAGPAVALQIGCKLEDDSGSVTVGISCDEIATQPGSQVRFTKGDFSAVVGGGLRFDVSGRTFTAGARYDHGFRNISNEDDLRHRVISVLATYEWPWRK